MSELALTTLENPSASLLPTDQTIQEIILIMTKPLGYYAGARSDHPDASLLERITEEFGSMLQELTVDDKAAVLICLVDAAVNPQQVLIEPNFFSNANGGELWRLAQQLSASNQLALSVALVEQLAYGGQG